MTFIHHQGHRRSRGCQIQRQTDRYNSIPIPVPVALISTVTCNGVDRNKIKRSKNACDTIIPKRKLYLRYFINPCQCVVKMGTYELLLHQCQSLCTIVISLYFTHPKQD